MRRRDDTLDAHLTRCGVSRRDFLGFCSRLMVAAPFGLAITNRMTPEAVAAELGQARRPSVIWLHFQDCTGCSETLLRTSQPDLADLIFHVISLDYHETLMAASGYAAEKALHEAMDANDGNFILVVEGSIPEKDEGIYMTLAGKPAIKVLEEVGNRAAAIIAIGSCASWGGVPSTPPNPTGAAGVDRYIRNKPIVNIPGCPPNPYVLLGVVLEYARYGTLPELDALRRPRFAFDRVIHDHCPRRPHFDAGRFAKAFGDDGHRQGWCLYELGCKGPDTHAACSTRHFNEVEDVWPIGIGSPCVGCTEQHIAFKIPIFSTIPIHGAKPPDTYPPVEAPAGSVAPLATGLVGLGVGAVGGAAFVASRRFSAEPGDESVPGRPNPEPKKEGEA
ncbi:MAG: hydrogenase small subunit [Deltaproteobacteria bacterium]|nr:hydrogenase small subunit [Deltaproteobacteria bacterium]